MPKIKSDLPYIDRASMSRKIKPDSCKCSGSGTFSTGLCKNVKYTVKIIKKWQKNTSDSCGAIDLGEAALKRKREAEWMVN